MLLRIIALVAIAGAAGAWFLTAPRPLPATFLDGTTGDATRGALVFAATGCASCHMAPEGGTDDVLPGGMAFATAFGTFHAPNISSDPVAGIGAWSDMQIANAVMRGIGADGEHLYPALPYTSYRAMMAQDMADLIAYLRTLPADPTPSLAHDIGFPFNIRRALGGWKWLFMPAPDDWVLTQAPTPDIARGRYLVEALGHCAECHTPRNALGALDRDRWLAGGPNPDGEGTIPNITPGTLNWSEAQIVAYLQSGLTPDYDSAGGSMAHVVKNTARLPATDLAAIAAYLKAVPSVAPADG